MLQTARALLMPVQWEEPGPPWSPRRWPPARPSSPSARSAAESRRRRCHRLSRRRRGRPGDGRGTAPAHRRGRLPPNGHPALLTRGHGRAVPGAVRRGAAPDSGGVAAARTHRLAGPAGRSPRSPTAHGKNPRLDTCESRLDWFRLHATRRCRRAQGTSWRPSRQPAEPPPRKTFWSRRWVALPGASPARRPCVRPDDEARPRGADSAHPGDRPVPRFAHGLRTAPTSRRSSTHPRTLRRRVEADHVGNDVPPDRVALGAEQVDRGSDRRSRSRPAQPARHPSDLGRNEGQPVVVELLAQPYLLAPAV